MIRDQIVVDHAGLPAMDGCARGYLVAGQRNGIAEGHVRIRRDNNYEFLATGTADVMGQDT
jgi:hypothetical protein